MIVDLAGDGVAMGSVADGVLFDMVGGQRPVQVAWTLPGSDDAFLAIDTNGNGRIDDIRELVGTRLVIGNGAPVGSGANALQYPLQGFLLDESSRPIGVPAPLPAGMAVLNKDDPGFGTLWLWRDSNHNGRSGPEELTSLPDAGVEDILLGFMMHGWTEGPVDVHGTRRILSGRVRVRKQGMLFVRELVEAAPARSDGQR